VEVVLAFVSGHERRKPIGSALGKGTVLGAAHDRLAEPLYYELEGSDGKDFLGDLATLTDDAIGLLSRMVQHERDIFLAGHELDLEAILRTAGSDAPALAAEILDATFQGLGIEWLNHADGAERDARLGLVVRRLLAKLLVARR